MKYVTAFATIVLSMASAHAAEFNPELKSIALKADSKELIATFQDHEPVSGTCPLYVERMEYVSAVDTLMVTLQPTLPCLRDDYGRRQGTLKWTLPEKLQISANVKLVINGKAAQALSIINGQVNPDGISKYSVDQSIDK